MQSLSRSTPCCGSPVDSVGIASVDPVRAGCPPKIIILIRYFFLLSLGLLLSSCHKPEPCRNVTISETISPNGQLKAVTFQRLCPEAHSISTHMSIIRANESLPDGNGNVFGYDNEIAIRLSWLSDSRLAVYTYADPAKATKIEHAGNVSIEYSRIVETYLITPPPDSIPEGSGTPAGAPSVAKP
jgi:hypothetical protein